MNASEAAIVATTPLPSAIRTLWRIVATLQAAVLAIVGIVIGVFVELWVLGVVLILVAFLFLALRWWVINLGYGRWRWGMDERWVERRSGVIVRATQIVPRSRVQTLTTKTGPIDRWLGLTSIVIHTAGTHTPNLTIPHLEREAAERLRAELGG